MYVLQDVINDIHGAQVLGMKAVLVKTGGSGEAVVCSAVIKLKKHRK